MRQLSICLSLLTMMAAYSDSIYAFQGDGTKVKRTPTPAPKPSAPSTARPSAHPPHSAMPTADLTVRTLPVGCQVFVNGQLRGSTNQDGFLNLVGLKPGNYTVIVRKAGYEEGQSPVTLYAGVNQEIKLQLGPSPVSLTVGASVAGARIEIRGVGGYTDRASVRLPPGRYSVIASKPSYGTVTRDVDLLPGRPENLVIALKRVTPEEMLAQVEQDFSNRSYTSAIATGLDLLRNQPDSPRINFLIGQSYYQSQQFAESVPYLVKAVELGEQVKLPIKHHKKDKMSFGLSAGLCTGELALQKGNWKYSGSCRGDFEIPYSKIQLLKPEPLNGGRLHVEVLIPDKKNKDKKEDYNFHVYQAELQKFDKSNPSSINVVRCDAPTCTANVEALFQILKQLKK